MLKTPDTKKNKNHNSGLLSRLTDKFKFILSALFLKDSSADTYPNDWDDDEDEHDDMGQPHEATSTIPQSQLLDSTENAQKSVGLKWGIILIALLCLAGYGIYLFSVSNKMKKRDPLSDTKQTTQKTTYSPSETPSEVRKQAQALFDSPLEVLSDPDDEFSKIDFDFSPIISDNIARTPQLPNRVKKKAQTQTASDELEALWHNGTPAPKSKTDDTPKTATEYLPAWRQYSQPYSPTNGKPVFSVILEYDPKILNINNLPQASGYNVVIPGFLEYSQTISNILRDKGYEILLYLPMGKSADVLSFKAITRNSTFDDIRTAVKFHTSQLGGKGFVGFLNYGNNHAINQSLSKMNFTMSLLHKTGHIYIDNLYNNDKSLAYAAALGQKVPSLKTSDYIHSVVDEFAQFINKVKLDGSGVAIVKATPENVIALKNYEIGIKNEGIVRIPISGLLKQKIFKKDN